MQVWTYANALTVSRIGLAPVFIICFMADGAASKFAAFVIACLFEITDLFDGYLARSRGEVTGIGKLIDPLADNISRFSVFLCLLARDYVPVWMIAIIFYRDAMVSYIRVGAAAHEVVLAARTTGKIKANSTSSQRVRRIGRLGVPKGVFISRVWASCWPVRAWPSPEPPMMPIVMSATAWTPSPGLAWPLLASGVAVFSARSLAYAERFGQKPQGSRFRRGR